VRLFPGAPSDREARDRTKGEHMARGGSGRSTGRRVRAAIRRGRPGRAAEGEAKLTLRLAPQGSALVRGRPMAELARNRERRARGRE